MKITQIGKCYGCNQFGKLDENVCEECLNHPNKGRKWAYISHKIRHNPDIARKVYDLIQTDPGRQLFISMYGLPNGAVPPQEEACVAKPSVDRPKLSLVK